jgi:hypothetical protein
MSSTTRSSTTAGDSQAAGANTEIPDGVEMTDPYADDPAFAFHAGGKMRIESRSTGQRTCRSPTPPVSGACLRLWPTILTASGH